MLTVTAPLGTDSIATPKHLQDTPTTQAQVLPTKFQDFRFQAIARPPPFFPPRPLCSVPSHLCPFPSFYPLCFLASHHYFPSPNNSRHRPPRTKPTTPTPTLTSSPYFAAPLLALRQQWTVRILVLSIHSCAGCFRARQLQGRCTPESDR
jgi:hypothetical protein